MKKVIFAVTTDLNYDQRMHRICTSLHQYGYQVLLVGREWAQSTVLEERPYDQHRLQCHFKAGKLFYLEYNLRLWGYLRALRADVYCAIDLDTALPMYIASRSAKAWFGYDAHEYFPEVPEVTGRPLIKWLWQAVERFVVPRADFAYTVSASLASLFSQRYGRPFGLVRNISPLQPLLPEAPRNRIILYQGALNAGRGLEQLLQAMTQVDGHLMICGEGDCAAQLRQLSAELGLSGKVTFTGLVLPDQLLAYTRQARVGVMLLENTGLSYYYSLANKFFDYIHAGIPQIVVDFPEYRKLNDQYQVAKLVSLQPDDIALSLNHLLHDEIYYNRLAQNCLQARKELNWQTEAETLRSIYDNLWQTKKAATTKP